MRQSAHAASRASIAQTPPVEVRYPFGVQNDLGQVILNSKSKDEAVSLSGPPSPPATRPSPGLSPSRLSLQSASLQYSYASSGDLSSDAALLERAIRCNDTVRVKRFLNLHHEKFPVNLHGSLLDKSSSDDSASQDVEILLRKSKTLIDKLEPTAGQYSSSSSSCHSVPASALIFSNALHVAVDHGAVEVARLLLKYGLEPDQGGRVPPAPPSPRRPQPPSRPCSPQPRTRTPSPKKPPEPDTCTKDETQPLTELSPLRYLKPTLPPSTPTATPTARRVSWIAPTSPPDMSKKRRATTKSLPRQRSFSLEHNNQLLGPGGSWTSERRSVSLKSSPLISPRPPDAESPAKVKNIVPERSIFAELRRSSEIFKSILLNLSMKDAEQQALEDEGESKKATPTENQIDVETLLAAHEQRKLATYQTESGFSSTSSSSLTSPSRSSRSSLSSPDEEDDGEEVLGIGSPTVIGGKEGPLLKLNPNIESEKVAGWMEAYNRQYLFTLPALFLAVIRGNATLVYLLLKYGASVNFQDRLGNTALHLAVCQENVPWECVLDLLEHGARIAVPNKAGVTPADLCSPHLLARLQHHMLQDCWQGLGDKKEPFPSSIVTGGSISISRTANNPSRILRKLRTARAESVEEATSCASGDQQLSSTGSIRSHGSTRSPDLAAQAIIAKESAEALKKKDSEMRKNKCRRKTWRDAARERQFSSVSEKQPVSAESGRSFHVLLSMSSNPECLGYLLRGILSHIPTLLRVLQQKSDATLHRSMAALLHNILKTALEAYGDPLGAGDSQDSRRQELAAACCLLLRVCLSLIHGVHDLQYTAMVTINKVIDAAVVHRLGHVRVLTSTALHHPCNDKKQPMWELPPQSPIPETPPPRPRPAKVSAKRLGSVWRHAAAEQIDNIRKPLPSEEPPQEECIFNVLSSVHALSVLNILHNALTLYKRVIGSKQQCSPSQRWRHCSYHCLQILAARALLFMTESTSVQTQLAQEPQLRILAAALDSTHDPLMLVLQIVATLALEPQHHKALLDNGLPDVLSQLLQLSDNTIQLCVTLQQLLVLVLQIVSTLALEPQHHKALLENGLPDVLSQLLQLSDNTIQLFVMLQQLLVLVLQIVATLALEPQHHKALLDNGLPDVLSQLLQLSDNTIQLCVTLQKLLVLVLQIVATLALEPQHHKALLDNGLPDVLSELLQLSDNTIQLCVTLQKLLVLVLQIVATLALEPQHHKALLDNGLPDVLSELLQLSDNTIQLCVTLQKLLVLVLQIVATLALEPQHHKALLDNGLPDVLSQLLQLSDNTIQLCVTLQQLLVLVLQIVATLALEPQHHKALLDNGLPDVLSQLLQLSDNTIQLCVTLQQLLVLVLQIVATLVLEPQHHKALLDNGLPDVLSQLLQLSDNTIQLCVSLQQLLVLVLQIVATLALEPQHHKALLDNGLPDVLSQLLQLSDNTIQLCVTLQQLLVLVLQIVATLALEPQHHKALLDNGLPDVLSQLLQLSDNTIQLCVTLQQLLVLVLQIVATLALEPQHHKALLDNGLPDVLSQLLQLSDNTIQLCVTLQQLLVLVLQIVATLVLEPQHHKALLDNGLPDMLSQLLQLSDNTIQLCVSLQQLLVLVLQIVATLALEPQHHKALLDNGLPDVLSQLLLPSDEWYYTNHSTKYARYVKHHVARILVYLGFQHRVNLRFCVYDILQDDTPPTPLIESVEDNYISMTSAPPSLVLSAEKTILGVSIESAIINVLKNIETSLTQGTTTTESSTLHWFLSGNTYSHNYNKAPVEHKLPSDPCSTLFVQTFLSCFPCVLNPIVLLRLMLHRLLTTAAHLQRWKSCASRSSFASASAHEVPKSPRSRASSTDTEPSTLRKRRKVNLTVDCTTGGWPAEPVEEPLPPPAPPPRALPRQSFLRGSIVPRDSVSSASGLGLEPAMQATLFAFSHILRPAHSKDSLRSNSSDDSGAGILPLPAFNLHLHHKPRGSFRFSSLRHSNKQRSKSQANITKIIRDTEERRKETPEQEILAFQKQLQNLPDFDSPEHPLTGSSDPVRAAAEFLAKGPHLRPRSRSMPRVTYESSRFLTLPETTWPTGGGSFRLPRGRSAGALGFQTEHQGPMGPMVISSPVGTPLEERRVSAGSAGAPAVGVSSRRSSLSPSDRNNRRRDSPACIQLEIPPWHRAILNFIEEWLRVSRVEIDRNPTLCRELRDFMTKVATCGQPYQQWCAELRQEFPSLGKDPDIDSGDDLEETDREYCQLLKLVVTGELPCSKEEAAALAGIQLRIEESWGRPMHHTPLSPDDPNTLKPISEDKESFLLPVPSFGPGGNLQRPVSPLVEDTEGEEGEGETGVGGGILKKFNTGVSTPGGPKGAPAQQTPRSTANSILRKCYPSSSPQAPFLPSGHLEDCLPPCYHGAKTMAKLIKEQKRKLFHTSVYESEIQLKKLYIQTCRRLPAHGCKVYQVKELLRGKTKKKAARLLGLGPDKIVLLDNKTKILAKSQNTSDLIQWRTGGGRSHDRLQLEFRAARWSLVVSSVTHMRQVGLALWEILQGLDCTFLEEHTLLSRFPNQDLVKRVVVPLQVLHSAELEELQRLLHFPEEVALRLADTENELFYAVPPIDYLRQVTLDLGGAPTQATDSPRASVRALVKRFNEVSSWVTHLIISQPTHEDRKCVLSCILRVALSCWNIGNFNGAMEIVAGLKSNKLKPFWLSITEKEPLPVLEFLSTALLSVEYDRALGRALAMPECKVVPFFGAFLRDLKDILSTTPSLVVLAPSGEHTHLEFISDYNGEDHYFTRIGPGGLINLDKIYRTQAVMDRIASFHQHYHHRERDTETFIDQISIHTSSIERSYLLEEKEDETSELDTYQPVQPLNNDHGVSFFPISAPHNNINHHTLQIMHHGTTMVHWDAEGGSRAALVYLRLERSCATLTWSRPTWSGLKTSGATSTADYSLSTNPEELIAPGLLSMGGEVASPGLEEGFLELSAVKEITLGARDKDRDLDLTNTLRRFNISHIPIDKSCLAIVYGANLSDNRVLFLLCPPSLCWTWYHGLCSVVRGLKRQLQQSDRRIIWLKEQYLQLYYEEGCCGPLTVDAIRVFGGRDWSDPGKISGMSPPDNGTCKRGPSVKFKKKRSIGNIQALKQDLACSRMAELGELVGGGTLRRGGPSPGAPPSRSRSISSEMEVPRITMLAQSPHGSSDHLDTASPTLLAREKMKNDVFAQIRNFRHGSITHETQLDFNDFVALFRSFSLRSRKDLRELFDQLAMSCRSLSDSSLNDTSAKNSPEQTTKVPRIGLLTRNSSADLMEHKNTPVQQKKKIFDAIAASSIISNCAGVDTSKSQVITLANFMNFLETKQMEHRTEEEVKELIQRHEPDPMLRSQSCLSFEGFARYMMDKENFAFVSERVSPDPNEMEYPLSQYYIASSHNTYLTGHQLKGESSVDLYSQVLLTGCRCVELDCWDGDDGSPLIYHGHTFTTKIAFRSVVEAINRSAFVTSPYPVILSIENHCSLQQQTRMAQIFLNVFGDKLIKNFIFEADFGDEPQLPSPLQLKYRILVKNKKLTAEIPAWPMQRGAGGRASQRPPQSGVAGTGRASSIISNTSGGSVNDDFSDDDDDDDDDDDENIDVQCAGGANVCPRTDSMSSHESAQKTPLRGLGKSPAAPQVDVDWAGYLEDEPNIHKAKKQSSQIAKELSDLVIYVQAIKFRGLNTISPNSSVRCKRAGAVVAATTSSAMLKKGSGSSVTLASSGSPGASIHGASVHGAPDHGAHAKRPNSNHPCYQTSSLNENSAKKLCRKQPHALMAHTETQLVRTYPAGMRIDSSNFNPVIFWAFGIQMVALNYQTDDAASHLNAAMFEQNGRCGYVPKPPVMRDRTHMMYRRFNPWEKEFDGLHSSHLILNLVSGQYLCPSGTAPGTNIVVEVELVGIPVDCNKQRTKNPTRNYVNPIFNETFFFKVMFRDLAFLRFNVLDQNTNHVLTQRVMPLKCLRPGYRHVRLRSLQNQPLPLSSLFICSRTEEESLDGSREQRGTIQEVRPDSSARLPGVKRRMFFLMVYGVVPDEPYTILKITQESTTQEVILQALAKAGVGAERAGDYVLVEEVARGWGGKEKDVPASQRVLDPQERPLQAQAQWQGVGKFLLKRLGDDPSSRAWLSSIRSTRNVKQARTWDEADNFLVCVYNVSPEIPYAILKVPLTACAQDVLAQALVKARRLEDPVKFVLVEELEWQSGGGRVQRVLPDEENIFRTQAHWQTIGRFILKEREVRKSGTFRPAFDRLSKGLSATLSDPTTTAKSRFPLSGLTRRGSREPTTTQREVHSEGETLSDDDGDLRTAVARLKRVSLRKLKVWKS